MPPAAVMGDSVVGVDMHIVLVPAPPAPPVPTPLPHPFSAKIMNGCITTVLIGGKPAAVVGSEAVNLPPHIPTPPGTSFVNPPQNKGPVLMGSTTVMIGGKPAARVGDKVLSCFDVPGPPSNIVGPGIATVIIGG